MIGLAIETSKTGTIWPGEYWKPLIDSLCRGGAKRDPRLACADLAPHLAPLVCERNGRYFPTSTSPLASHDDKAISMLTVVRVPPGDESISFSTPSLPDTTGWCTFEFPYFGTIGNSKYESQTKRNLDAVAARQHEFLQGTESQLLLHFELSGARRDRDLDNLADALIPLFNRLIPKLAAVYLSKSHTDAADVERLLVSADEV